MIDGNFVSPRYSNFPLPHPRIAHAYGVSGASPTETRSPGSKSPRERDEDGPVARSPGDDPVAVDPVAVDNASSPA
jgi:hypothetical protein